MIFYKKLSENSDIDQLGIREKYFDFIERLFQCRNFIFFKALYPLHAVIMNKNKKRFELFDIDRKTSGQIDQILIF